MSTRLGLQADLRSVHPAGQGQLAATLGQPPSRLAVIGERPLTGIASAMAGLSLQPRSSELELPSRSSCWRVRKTGASSG